MSKIEIVLEKAEQSEKTMTTKEIAAALGVSYDTVNRCVKRCFPDKLEHGKKATFDEAEIAIISKELKSNNYVSSQLTVAAGATVKNTTTRLEVLANYKAATQAMIELLEAEKAELQAQVESQAAKIKEDAPKVDFYNAVTDSTDCIDIAQVAKILNVQGVGRNKLFQILRNKAVLDYKNMPYQKYVDKGFFRVIEKPYLFPGGTQRINLQTLVLQKGLDFIRKILKEGKE